MRGKGVRWIVAVVAIILVVAAVIVGLVVAWWREPIPEGEATARPTGEGWVDLLDEAHVAGWKDISGKRNIFEIKDGMLHIFGGSSIFLRYVGYTAEQFNNVDLHIEFKLAKGTNSGVFLRAALDDVHRGFEVQVLDDRGDAPNKNGCGAIYDVVSPMFNMSKPAGEWNSYDISLNGREVWVHMNGWLVVHTDMSKMTSPIGKFATPYAKMPLEGYLALQDHGGEVWYRNIVVRRR